jgi:hypothetical protein
MAWPGSTCKIETCDPNVGLSIDDKLTFPPHDALKGEENKIKVGDDGALWGTVVEYVDGSEARVSYNGNPYRITFDSDNEVPFTCRPDPPPVTAALAPSGRPWLPLAGGVLGVVAGTVIGGLLGLPLAATVAVATVAALPQVAITLWKPSNAGEAGTTWTARDGNA